MIQDIQFSPAFPVDIHDGTAEALGLNKIVSVVVEHTPNFASVRDERGEYLGAIRLDRETAKTYYFQAPKRRSLLTDRILSGVALRLGFAVLVG